MGRLRLSVRGRSQDRIPVNADRRINDGMREAITEATHDGKLLTQAATPKRTGRTATTVDDRIVGGGAHVSGHFGSDDQIFEYLERGTRPHEIRGNPWLYWPGARHPVRKVNHPGTRPHGMLEAAGPIAGQVAKWKLRDVYAEVFG